jgi:hypothetical protein
MTTCSYCNRPATTTIIAIPHQVCQEHATEFWTGLLGYSQGRSGRCVKHERLCSCPACEELSASQARSFAVKGVEPSPGDHVGFAMPLAS